MSELTTQGKARSAVISDLPVTMQVEKSYPTPRKERNLEGTVLKISY